MNRFLGALGDWPGKRDDQDRRHPAVWHMLDVAASAELLVASGPLRRLPHGLQRAIVFLIALHDCGKISQAFRDQIETRRSPPEHCRRRQLSEQMLLKCDDVLARVLGGDGITVVCKRMPASSKSLNWPMVTVASPACSAASPKRSC